MKTMEFFLGGNWICARDGTWRFSGKYLRWILAGRCNAVFGWKIPDGPWIGDLDVPVVEKWKRKGTRGMRWDFTWIFQ